MTLLSSFSLSMLNELPAKLELCEVSLDDVKKLALENKLDFKIGHPSYATVLSKMLGVNINSVREKFILKPKESVIVAQIISDRLPEGKLLTAEEIEKLEIKFIEVKLI